MTSKAGNQGPMEFKEIIADAPAKLVKLLKWVASSEQLTGSEADAGETHTVAWFWRWLLMPEELPQDAPDDASEPSGKNSVSLKDLLAPEPLPMEDGEMPHPPSLLRWLLRTEQLGSEQDHAREGRIKEDKEG